MDTKTDTAAASSLAGGAGNDTIAAGAVVAPEANPWKHTIIACGAKIATAIKNAKVIVVQTRTRPAVAEGEAPSDAFVPRAYAVGDVYLRFDPRIDFGDVGEAEVLEMGTSLPQNGFGGLSTIPGEVCVGPAHPAYAAMDLAKQRGAAWVTFDSLDEGERQKLTPWLVQVKAEFDKIDFT